MPALVAALEGKYYLDEEAMIDAVRRKASFSIIHLQSMMKVDVFVIGDDPYDEEEMNRRHLATLGDPQGTGIYLASAEDLILKKLDWYHRGEGVSDRQWRDVLGLLKVQAGRLDLDYLSRWAATLQLAELLKKALAEAGLS